MRMGDRRLKRLDALGVNVANKTELEIDPTNRAQRRKLNRELRQAGVPGHERELIVKEGVTAALEEDR